MANYSFNKIIIIGRIGQEPVLKAGAKTDTAMFTLCNSVVKDGKEEVQWHNIVSFGKLAKLAMDYLHKGDLVCIEGPLDLNAYNGERIIAERMTFLASKKRETKPESAECKAV